MLFVGEHWHAQQKNNRSQIKQPRRPTVSDNEPGGRIVLFDFTDKFKNKGTVSLVVFGFRVVVGTAQHLLAAPIAFYGKITTEFCRRPSAADMKA